MFCAAKVSEMIDACVETGFEYHGWVREGKVAEISHDNEPQFSADIVLIDGYILHPSGYSLTEIVQVRAKMNYLADYLRKATDQKVKVDMPAQELQDALPVIHEAVKEYGLDLNLSHGFDGHGDAIGIAPPKQPDPRQTKSFCLRFENDRFRLHGWCAPELESWRSVARELADVIERSTGRYVVIE